MPELPDVVVYLEALTRYVVGRRLERLTLYSPFVLRTVDPPITAIEGRIVRAVTRIGKRIVLVFDHELPPADPARPALPADPADPARPPPPPLPARPCRPPPPPPSCPSRPSRPLPGPPPDDRGTPALARARKEIRHGAEVDAGVIRVRARHVVFHRGQLAEAGVADA